jgi:hypothetical protein
VAVSAAAGGSAVVAADSVEAERQADGKYTFVIDNSSLKEVLLWGKD